MKKFAIWGSMMIAVFLLISIIAPKTAEACARVLGKTDTHVKVAIEGNCSLATVARMFPQIDPETKQKLSVMDGVRSMYADKLNKKTVKFSCVKGKPSGWTLTPDEEKMCAGRGKDFYPNYWGIASVGNIMPIYIPRTRQFTEVEQLRKENAKLKALLEQYKSGAPPVETVAAVADPKELQILQMKLGSAQNETASVRKSAQKVQSISLGIGGSMLVFIGILAYAFYRSQERLRLNGALSRINEAGFQRRFEHQEEQKSDLMNELKQKEDALSVVREKLEAIREEKEQADAELMHQAERAILAESLLAERERRVRRLHAEMDTVEQERDQAKNAVKELTDKADRLEVERMMLHSNLRKFESSSTEKNEKFYSTENVDVDDGVEVEFDLMSVPPVGSGEWMIEEIKRELAKEDTTPEDRECLTDLQKQLQKAHPEESEKVVCNGLEKMELIRSFWRKEETVIPVAEA